MTFIGGGRGRDKGRVRSVRDSMTVRKIILRTDIWGRLDIPSTPIFRIGSKSGHILDLRTVFYPLNNL